MNIKEVGYKKYRATANLDGTIRTFHPLGYDNKIMLDIYLLNSKSNKEIDSPCKDDYLISFSEFKKIEFLIKYAKENGIIISFSSDFEIPYSKIDNLLSLSNDEEIVNKLNKKNSTTINKLKDTLENALQKGKGIIGFAD